MGDDTDGFAATGQVDERSCRRGGQASALTLWGRRRSRSRPRPTGGPLQPSEADEGAVALVEEEMGSPRVGVVAAGAVEGVRESFRKSSPSFDHGDAESFGERRVPPSINASIHSRRSDSTRISHHLAKSGPVGAGGSHPPRLPGPGALHKRAFARTIVNTCAASCQAPRMVTVPVSPSTRTSTPLAILLVASTVPTTAGKPISRPMIAACEAKLP